MVTCSGVIRSLRHAVKRCEEALGLAEPTHVPPGDWDLLPYDFRVEWLTESRFLVTQARLVRADLQGHKQEDME